MTMEPVGVSFHFDENAINEYLRKAILDSSIGDIFREVCKKNLNEYNIRSSITHAIDHEIRRIVTETVREFLIQTESQKLFKQIVAEKATEQVISDIAAKAWEVLEKSIKYS